MTREHDIQNSILLALGSTPNWRLFRQNVGVGWSGQVVKGPRKNITLGPRDVVVRNARPLHAGLCPGSSDLIGWRVVTITPGMVGQSVALFSAIEVKTEDGKATPEQQRFISAVKSAGGVAGVARSVEEASAL